MKKYVYLFCILLTFILFLPNASARWVMEGAVVHQASKRITCGYLCYSNHYAVDIGHRNTAEENRIYALASGTVTVAVDGYSNGQTSYGNWIEIDHGNGLKTRYAHLAKGSLTVRVGDTIHGSRHAIAMMGDSGNANGVHLHFEVISNGVKVNPTPYLSWGP